jgi:hypothetical protein
MTETKTPDPVRLFKPDTFFLKPWLGWGVVRDGRGRTVERYTAEGEGRTSSRSAASTMVLTYEDGRRQTFETDILSDADGHFYARDLKTGVEARGAYHRGDFRWVFSPAPIPGATGLLKLVRAHSTATYVLTSPSTAVGFTEVRVFGILVRTMTSFFQHVEK